MKMSSVDSGQAPASQSVARRAGPNAKICGRSARAPDGPGHDGPAKVSFR